MPKKEYSKLTIKAINEALNEIHRANVLIPLSDKFREDFDKDCINYIKTHKICQRNVDI